MAKITRHGGPSDQNTGLNVGSRQRGAEVSPGSSSSPSPEKPRTSSEPKQGSDPSPAPTTESPSVKGRAAGSTARSTGGGRTKGK